MIWKGLALVTNSESPIVVVLRFVIWPLRMILLRNLVLFWRITIHFYQWKYGTSFPPRWSPTSHQPSQGTHPGWRYMCFPDTTSRYSNCSSSHQASWRVSSFGAWWSTELFWHFWVPDRAKSGKQYLLTKGDNNNIDDRGLYNARQMWIHKEHVVGKVRG